MRKKFIITVDTEGDNLWERKITRNGLKKITTENAKNLEKFQTLCERYKFIPTYLTNYEMSQNDIFVSLARNALKRNTCEVGMHMHAWNSPPVVQLRYNPRGNHPYLGEYEKKVQWEKMKYLTCTIEDIFQVPVTSFRSGRWYLDEFTVKCLEKLGYIVDCTVTPNVSWSDNIGNNIYGIDYSKDKFVGAYVLSNKNIHKSGNSHIYEVPPTILCRYKLKSMLPKKEVVWLRPNGINLKDMLWIVKKIKNDKNIDYLEFMIHSSELSPGMNPNFKSIQSINNLYSDLEYLFNEISKDYDGIGLSKYVLSKYMK